MKLPLPLTSARRDEPANTGRLVNMMPEESERGPRLVRAPGVRAWRSFGNGPGRGLHVMGGGLYVVSGQSLYNSAGAVLGTLPGSEPVSMADNGSTLAIAANGEGYAYTGTLAAFSDTDFPGASEFDFLDGYFTFIEPGTGRFWVTDLYSTAVDPLKFATAEGAPDPVVNHIVDHREAILFGTQSVERWWNSGADNFPLERSPNGFMELGCLGGVAKLDNSVYWVANDITVRRLQGAVPVRVSTHAVEQAMRGYTGTPRAFTYTLDGHLCYVVTWNEGTWVHDITTGAWYERSSYLDERWRVCAAVSLNGQVYVQDRDTGAVGILDPNVYTEWGATVIGLWQYPSVHQEGRRLFHGRLELRAEPGVGLIGGDAPQVMLAYSDDGGKTFDSLPARDIGSIGQYRDRCVWYRLGSARERVYRMAISDPVQINVLETTLQVS